MTISYSRQVATSNLGTFVSLLLRWKGSIYKLLYREVIIFLAIYGTVSCVYRIALTSEQRYEFEQFALFCEETAGMIPITFILGFYVSLIVSRWWNIFINITYPDRLMLQVASYLHGRDERARICRRTVARYANLSQLLVLRDISSAVRKRFPTMQHIVDAGFMTEDELQMYENIAMVHHKFWMPLQWICSVIYANRKEGRIENDQQVVRIVNEILNLRTMINTLLSYDWISVPLVYTQVVTIAVYSYFLASIFGRQYLDPSKRYAHHEVDMYFPLFTLLQFVFYMGWLKVAESIMNPLGEDDDDFEVNYLIERNLQVGYAMADDNYMKIPPMKRDLHWNVPEASVPHTFASAGLKDAPYVPSARPVEVKPNEVSSSRSTRSTSTASMTRNSLPNGYIRKQSSFSYSPTNRPGHVAMRRIFSTVVHPFFRRNSQRRSSRTLAGLDELSASHETFPNSPVLPSRSISLQSTRPYGLPMPTLYEVSEKPFPNSRRSTISGPKRKNNDGRESQPLVPQGGGITVWRLGM